MKLIPFGQAPFRFVFLHGLFGRGRNWTTIARRLAPQSSLLIDLPNHGDSEWTTSFSYPEMARELADTLTGLDTPICLVGHSMGGRLAMLVALTYPDLVERLVVEDTVPATMATGGLLSLAQAMAALPLTQIRTRHEAKEMLRGSINDETILGFLLQNLQPGPQGSWRWVLNLEVLVREMAEVGRWPEVSTCYQGPVLWITGEKSDHAQDQWAMRALFPLARQLRVKSAGHWVHAEAPGLFTEAVRRFAASAKT